MGLKSVSQKIITIAAATALLAACSQSEEPVSTPDDDMMMEEDMDDGSPDVVITDPVEEEELMDPFGSPTQMGLEMYAGADRVFFDYDSSELTEYARQVLAKQADFLDHFKSLEVAIEGHCDERGTREYNLALGERRATAVKNYLMALGVSGDRLDTISYGKERPVVVGNSESSWRQNRRGVLKITS